MSPTIPERTATAADLADHAARARRALDGQQRPRTLHAIAEQAVKLTHCPHCSAVPGRVCKRGGGYHVARFAAAVERGTMTSAEFEGILDELGAFRSNTVVYDVKPAGAR